MWGRGIHVQSCGFTVHIEKEVIMIIFIFSMSDNMYVFEGEDFKEAASEKDKSTFENFVQGWFRLIVSCFD